jgi:hypothetical protein
MMIVSFAGGVQQVNPDPVIRLSRNQRPRFQAADCREMCQSGWLDFLIGPKDLISALAPRVRWHQVVRTIVDHKLAIVLAAVLDGERPDAGVVGQPVSEKF